jgi:hypothetical protein
MALENCISCEHEIDASAKSCPSCGSSDPTGLRTKIGLWLFAIVAVLWVVGSISGGSP